MHKSLKQSNSSEKSPSPISVPEPNPQNTSNIHSLFLSLFIGAVSGNRETVLEYIYANLPQLETQELRSIGICEKSDGEQAGPS